MKSCNRKILELFYNAKHTGRISKPDAVGRIGENDEGLVIELTWRVIDGVIADAKFRAFGNPNAIAITSLMVDHIIGKSIDDAVLINEDVIIDNLDEFRPEYIEVYDVVHACIIEAYENYKKRENKTNTRVYTQKDYYHEEEVDESVIVAKQIQRELQGEVEVVSTGKRGRPRKVVDETEVVTIGEKRGRGRPRKEVDPNAIIEVGEKRGRGRPRKEVDPNAVVEVGEKRGRGRPRKIVDESKIVEVGEKRGRGRPRKEIDPNAITEVGEKRGRGRPRKIVEETEIVEVGEKRGRGRPRKIVDESEIVEMGEKRGRGRPRKEIDPNEIIEVGEKRGRGRPRKEIDPNVEVIETVKRGRGRPRKVVDESEVVVEGEKRGRGRPRKDEVVFNIPSDLNEVEFDEDMEQLISGSNRNETAKIEEINKIEQPISISKLIDEDDDTFDADYDLFKSNIRSIFSGKEVSSKTYGHKTETVVEPKSQIEEKKIKVEPTKAEPVKIIVEEEDLQEKRGRGRPRKDGVPSAPHEKSSVNAVSSITRSLTPNAMPMHSSQDIVFASKNVTTTNININVTKTTTSVDDNTSSTNDYSHNISSSERKVEVTLPKTIKRDEEIDVEPVKVNPVNKFDDIDDDFDEDIDTSKIKDEAPSGGLEDLLKALLDD